MKTFPETRSLYGHFDVFSRFVGLLRRTGQSVENGPFFDGFSRIAPERLDRLRWYGCLKMRLVNTLRMVCVMLRSDEN